MVTDTVAPPLSLPRFRKLASFRPNGHAFFYDAVTRGIAIADCSGNEPADTEDGILWVDPSQPIVRIRNNWPCIGIITEAGNHSLTPASFEELQWVAARFAVDLNTITE